LKKPKILHKSDGLSRVLEIRLKGKTLHTPTYFPSISSYGVKFSLRDLLYFVKFHSHPCVLVSAYDLYYLEEDERKKLLSIIKDYRKQGVLFLDSGLYESSWKVDPNWDINSYKGLMTETKSDFYSSFDVFRSDEQSDEEFRKHTFDNIVESSVFLDNVLFVPILHETSSDKLIDFVKEFVEKHPELCGSIAVAERDCGRSIVERAETIVQIRRILNNNDCQNLLHVLGCGNPKSMLLFSYCGADSFDSLDWLKHVINPADHSVHDFSHLELLNCKCHVCTASAYKVADYLEKALLHSLLYYRIFVDHLQSLIRNGIIRSYLTKHIGEKIIKQIDKL